MRLNSYLCTIVIWCSQSKSRCPELYSLTILWLLNDSTLIIMKNKNENDYLDVSIWAAFTRKLVFCIWKGPPTSSAAAVWVPVIYTVGLYATFCSLNSSVWVAQGSNELKNRVFLSNFWVWFFQHFVKVIYHKYSKHWTYTVAHTIDCVCRKC